MIATLFTAVTIVDTPTIRFMAKRQLRWPRCEDRGITASGTNNHQLLGKKEITMDDSKTENNKANCTGSLRHSAPPFYRGQDEISGFFQFVRDLYPGFVNNPGCGLAV